MMIDLLGTVLGTKNSGKAESLLCECMIESEIYLKFSDGFGMKTKNSHLLMSNQMGQFYSEAGTLKVQIFTTTKKNYCGFS